MKRIVKHTHDGSRDTFTHKTQTSEGPFSLIDNQIKGSHTCLYSHINNKEDGDAFLVHNTQLGNVNKNIPHFKNSLCTATNTLATQRATTNVR